MSQLYRKISELEFRNCSSETRRSGVRRSDRVLNLKETDYRSTVSEWVIEGEGARAHSLTRLVQTESTIRLAGRRRGFPRGDPPACWRRGRRPLDEQYAAERDDSVAHTYQYESDLGERLRELPAREGVGKVTLPGAHVQ